MRIEYGGLVFIQNTTRNAMLCSHSGDIVDLVQANRMLTADEARAEIKRFNDGEGEKE